MNKIISGYARNIHEAIICGVSQEPLGTLVTDPGLLDNAEIARANVGNDG